MGASALVREDARVEVPALQTLALQTLARS